MATIVMTDHGLPFDGRSPERGPLGGAESAFVSLAEALAARGHRLRAFTSGDAALDHRGVEWRPLAEGAPDEADLHIANRGDRVLLLVPRARRRAFWIHNPASYLLKWRYLSKLWRREPVLVFLGPHHARSYPRWAPGGARRVIPLGVERVFMRERPASSAPPPRVVFTSNPLRGLDRLLDLWVERIRPRVTDAELHLFSGAAVYGGAPRHGAAMTAVLERAARLTSHGVICHTPVAKAQLAEQLRSARAMLYQGDPGETFCLAVAEAQASGVPAVVSAEGAVAERVVDGVTGFAATSEHDFVEAGIRLLSDDALWLEQHRAALARQGARGWDAAAAAFEALLA